MENLENENWKNWKNENKIIFIFVVLFFDVMCKYNLDNLVIFLVYLLLNNNRILLHLVIHYIIL